MTSDVDRFVAAGLYDPGQPHAEQRLTLLRRLIVAGHDLDEMVDVDRSGWLPGLVLEDLRDSFATMTGREVGEAVDQPLDDLEAYWTANGLPTPDPDELAYTPEDVTMFAALRELRDSIGPDGAYPLLRVVGSSFARISDAVISMFDIALSASVGDDAGDLEVAAALLTVAEQLDETEPALTRILEHHLNAAVRRWRMAKSAGEGSELVRYAVGFVDLVGYTRLTRALGAADLAGLLAEFEAAAFASVAAHDGRVVKLIGDEVMFVTHDPVAACDVAIRLIEWFGLRGAEPRGGVAVGTVVSRGGDFFGEPVNLAARLCDVAVPGEVLVTEEVAAGGAPCEPAGRRLLKGFDEPVRTFSVSRVEERGP